MTSRRQLLTTLATIVSTFGITGCVTDINQQDSGTSTIDSSNQSQTEEVDWKLYRSEQFGFEIQHPAEASLIDVSEDYSPQIPKIDESTSGVETRSALLVARKSDIQLTVGHIDTSIDRLRENLAGESRQGGEEAKTQYSDFNPKPIAGKNGYEIDISRYSGTGAGTEGFSCSGKGAMVSAPNRGTLFLFVERCVSDITSDPERTSELTKIFEEMVKSIQFSD